MRSVIICILSLLFVPAMGAPAGNGGLPSLSSHPPSTGANQPTTHNPQIQLAPMNPPSTRPPSTQLPSIHQLPIPQPPRRQDPTAHPPSPHGRLVGFQGDSGPHVGMILGSEPDQQRKFKVAPVRIVPHGPEGRPVLAASNTHVVKVHPGDMVGSRYSKPNEASRIMQHHANNPPTESHAAGPIRGSRFHPVLGRPRGSRQG